MPLCKYQTPPTRVLKNVLIRATLLLAAKVKNIFLPFPFNSPRPSAQSILAPLSLSPPSALLPVRELACIKTHSTVYLLPQNPANQIVQLLLEKTKNALALKLYCFISLASVGVYAAQCNVSHTSGISNSVDIRRSSMDA